MNSLNIVVSGEAGSGIQTVETLLCEIFRRQHYVFSTKEYMSRVRGGANTTTIRISDSRINGFCEKTDILLSLDKKGIERIRERITSNTLIFGDVTETEKNSFSIDFSKIALETGNKVFSNTVATGFILGLLNKDKEIAGSVIGSFFATKGDQVIKGNIEALNKGYLTGQEFRKKLLFEAHIETVKEVERELFINGAEAVGTGAILGGCNFISSYPMTPSTPVFTFLAQHSKDFNIIVEQAEDEISAINMVLGSWYAGGRAMVSTSGGGFALMVESISLSGMIESPVVIHLGQRPGPATGLPTRTEQGDLLFSLFSGHGEFPRVIFAPGDLNESIFLTAKAFNIADKYQIPVFILTDQYLIDTYYNIPEPDFSLFDIEYYYLKGTDPSYRRYKFTDNGISERAIPGNSGFVCLDSDEHDEDGHITEDREIRRKMVEKRNKKIMNIAEIERFEPCFYGHENYEILVLSWGSTKNTVLEAISQIDGARLGYLHFSIIYPLPSNIDNFFRKAKKTIVIENNYTSQFSKLLKMEKGIEVKEKILKYDGHPFSVEQITNALKEKI